MRYHRHAIALTTVVALAGCASPHAQGHPHGGHDNDNGRYQDAAACAGHFEDPGRDEWQKPQVVLEELKLPKNAVVVDIGSATGYFPVRIAPAVPEGRVWGVDIEPDMVRYLNDRARQEGLQNLYSVLGTPDDPLIPEPADVVIMVNTYHHISDRARYLGKLRSYLRPGGRVVIIDYKKGKLKMGPPDERKLSPAEVDAEFREAGFRLAGQPDLLPMQYILIFSAE